MSKANPVKAIEALLPESVKCSGGITVLPLSLAHYGLLEKIDSPLLWDTSKPCSVLEILPSLYVVTHSSADTFADFENLFDRALAWGETCAPNALSEIRNAVGEQIKKMLAVIPVPAEGKKKADTTAGS